MSDSVFMGAIQAGLMGAGIGFMKGMADRMDVVAAGTVAIWNRLGDLEDGIHGLHQEARRQADAAEATAGAAIEANLRAETEARQADISDTTRAYHAFCQKAVAVGMATQVQCRLFQELGADGTTLIGLIEGLAHEPSGLSAEGQHRARQAVATNSRSSALWRCSSRSSVRFSTSSLPMASSRWRRLSSSVSASRFVSLPMAFTWSTTNLSSSGAGTDGDGQLCQPRDWAFWQT